MGNHFSVSNQQLKVKLKLRKSYFDSLFWPGQFLFGVLFYPRTCFVIFDHLPQYGIDFVVVFLHYSGISWTAKRLDVTGFSSFIFFTGGYTGFLSFPPLGKITFHNTIRYLFWPRAMLKGPKRSFVVVLVGRGNHEQKMFQMEQKMFANKNCSKWFKKCSRTKNVPNGTKNVQGDKKCSYKSKWSS